MRRALFVLAVLGMTSSAPASTMQSTPGPVLVVRTVAAGERAPAAGDDDLAMSLALASIAPRERRRILDDMGYAASWLEARLSPLVDDFGDDGVDPVDELRRALAPEVPQFTAARAFEAGRWAIGTTETRVAASCAEARDDERCVPIWSAEMAQDPSVRRAGLAAWAVTRAAVVDLGTPEAADSCAAALRERASARGAATALVVTEADLALDPVPERPVLKDAAVRLGRAMAANEIDDTQHLDAFAHAKPTGRAAPWLRLGRTEILVVPRLSAIARADDLAVEIERAAGASKVRWVHRPR